MHAETHCLVILFTLLVVVDVIFSVESLGSVCRLGALSLWLAVFDNFVHDLKMREIVIHTIENLET